MSSSQSVNRFYSGFGLTIRAESPVPSNQGQSPKSKRKEYDSPPVTPDSTTEQQPTPVKRYQEGEDVFFETDNGQHVLGTVGQIVGQTCQILFGDGTQQWAPFKRVTKLSSAKEEDDNEDDTDEPGPLPLVAPSKAKSSSNPRKFKPCMVKRPGPRTSQSAELPCASCGIQRRVSQKKALQFGGTSSNLFRCRHCSNQYNSSMPIRNARDQGLIHAGPFIKPTLPKPSIPQRKISLNEDNCNKPIFNKAGLLQPGHVPTSSHLHNGEAGKNGVFNHQNTSLNKIPTVHHPHLQPKTEVVLNCFHCEKGTKWYNRVHCNLCDRPCHLVCLSMTPVPMDGDRFWDVMCSSCGTQNQSESSRAVFSVRRNISSWSDIVQLVISCLSVESPGQSFYDLASEILPFLQTYIGRLHLPRQYKLAPLDERKNNIETALNNSKLRFVNGKEVGGKQSSSQWAIRKENFSQHYQSPQRTNFIDGKRPSLPNQHSQIYEKIMDTANLKRKYIRKDAFVTKIQSPKMTLAKKSTAAPPIITAKRAYEKESTLNNLNKTRCDIPLRQRGTEYFVKEKNGNAGSIVQNNIVRLHSPSRLEVQQRSSSSDSTTSSSSSSSTSSSSSRAASANEPLPTKPRRGRPKGRMLKRSFSPSQRSEGPIPFDLSPSKKNIPQVALPLSKKFKDDMSPPKKDISHILLPNSISGKLTLSPVRPVQKVATIITPPKLLANLKTKSASDQPTISWEGAEKVNNNHDFHDALEIGKDESERSHDLPRAVKTASLVPAPAPQIQVLLRKELLKDQCKRPGRAGRPKLSLPSGKLAQHKLKSTPGFKQPILRLRPRGRPAGSKNLRTHFTAGSTNSSNPSSPLKSAQNVSTNGISKPQSTGTPSKKTSNGSGISDRNRIHAQEKLAQSTNLQNHENIGLASNLFEAAVYGNIVMHCLPRSPETEVEKRKETFKVFSHFRLEKEDHAAALLLARSETETRSQSRRKSELFGMQKRDLNDFDSYELMGKRVDPDGTTRYFIAWKTPGQDDESTSSSEDESMKAKDNVFFSSSTSSIITKLAGDDGHEDEEISQYVLEVGRCKTGSDFARCSSPDVIDLTESS